MSYGSSGPATDVHEVAMAPTPTDRGYWVATSDGRVLAYGDAAYQGSLAGQHLKSTIVGMAARATGHGYWLVGADGGMVAYGDAGDYGSAGDGHLSSPIVGMAATPSGGGYWLVGADGALFAYGDATFAGALNGQHLTSPIVGMAATPSGHGYWLVAADGGVSTFGDASITVRSWVWANPTQSVSALTPTPSGKGYWVINGAIFSFGDATYRGAVTAPPASTVVTGLTATSDGAGYWEATAPAPAPPPPGPAPATTAVAAGTPGTSLGTFVVTCYDDHGTTASGASIGLGTVAVDPSVIPLGTRIDIAGASARIVNRKYRWPRRREPNVPPSDTFGSQPGAARYKRFAIHERTIRRWP